MSLPYSGYSYRTPRNNIPMFDYDAYVKQTVPNMISHAVCDYEIADTLFEIADAEFNSSKEFHEMVNKSRGRRSLARQLMPYLQNIGIRLADQENDRKYIVAATGFAGLCICRHIASVYHTFQQR